MCQHLFGFSKPESRVKETTTLSTILLLHSSDYASINPTCSASTKQGNKQSSAPPYSPARDHAPRHSPPPPPPPPIPPHSPYVPFALIRRSPHPIRPSPLPQPVDVKWKSMGPQMGSHKSMGPTTWS